VIHSPRATGSQAALLQPILQRPVSRERSREANFSARLVLTRGLDMTSLVARLKLIPRPGHLPAPGPPTSAGGHGLRPLLDTRYT
jgi:hypothetical protein